MNSTTTYKRTMFGLSEINADTINCNDLTLSGSLKTNLITSTSAGQNLTLNSLGSGDLIFQQGSITKMTTNETEMEITNSDVRIKDGKVFRINNAANTQSFSIGMTAGATNHIYFNMTSLVSFYMFAIANVEKFRISNTQITSTIFITVPTEVVGSSNSRVANTAFVTTATLGLTGITYSNVGSIDTTTIDNNVRVSTGKVLTIGTIANAETELLKVSAMDYSDPDYTTFVYSIFQCDNTFVLPSYPDVKITLDNLSISVLAVTGITYNSITDTTTIANNLTIGAGKVLAIPNFSNVETTLTTFNTNLTGITYSAPFPLFIPKTTIAHDLEIATGKMITSDEIWNKLYSTHDLTDTVGVGYFKSFFYNDGSIGYISTVNPIDVYDGTGTEIRIKVSTQEIGFNTDGLCLFNSAITLCDDVELPTYPSLVAKLDSLTSEIATINSTLSTLTSIPVATIISSMATTAPAGYLALNGQLVLIASYSALYAIIGTVWNPLYTPGVPTGYFYLADTKGAFLRGAGLNGMTTYSHCEGSYAGGFQIDLVKEHNHEYQVSSGTQDVSVGTATARNNATDTYHTSNELYNASNVAFGHAENRVFNMAINYYIKY